MRFRPALLLPLALIPLLLAGCSSAKKQKAGNLTQEAQQTGGGAYGVADESGGAPSEMTGGAYGEPAEPEEMLLAAPAAAGYASSPVYVAMRYAPPPPPSTEKYPEAGTNPVKAVAQEPVSTFSIDVDTASYANVRRFLEDGQLPPADAVRVEELINYFDYDYPLPATKKRPFEATVALAPSPWSEGKTLLHIGLQGYDVKASTRPDLNLVLLLDVSGSMAEADRLPLVQKALRVLVDDLEKRDRVSIVVYAGAAGVVLPPTPGNQKEKILGALNMLSAGGSTAGGQGIELAYRMAEQHLRKGAVNRVILATDGDFNVGISDPKALEAFVAKKRATGIYLSLLGVGRGNYQDLTMQKLAQAGNGNAAYIDTLSEARKVLHDEVRASLLPIADDVKIQVEFNPGRVAEYRLIGYETRMLKREDFSNDRIDAGEIGAGANVTAIYELTPPGGKTLLEPLRYQKAEATPASDSKEFAFLRIRYKTPGAKESVLIERPITDKDAYASLAQAPESTRFATAVAAYGQMLRGDTSMDAGYGWDQVIELANGAKGRDDFGWRAEFVQLTRGAKSLSPRSK